MDINKIRSDFPALKIHEDEKPVIYFDNASDSLTPQPVIEAMVEHYSKPANNWSAHKYAIESMLNCKKSREKVSILINADTNGEIIWTKNATEGINLVAKSLRLEKGDIVVTTNKEHNSNVVPWQMLDSIGVVHEVVKSHDDLTLDMEYFSEMMSEKVKLVSMAYTSILDGYTIPAKEIIKTAHDYGALVMLDAVQTVPWKPVDVKELDVDFLVFSLHNMYGPNGIGVLYGKAELLEERLNPFLGGGGTVLKTTYERSEFQDPPAKFEAGDLNFPGIVCAGATVDYINSIGIENIQNHTTELNKYMTKVMQDFDGLKLLGPVDASKRGPMFNFNIEGINPHDIAIHLEEEGNVLVRSGALCTHAWFLARESSGAVSVSFQIYNTKEEIDKFIEIMRQLLD